jgi:NTP pyrophosphatase (non-canonical NTP hydrolase)
MLSLNDYQINAWSYALSQSRSTMYLLAGLVGEQGEFASEIAKAQRDGTSIEKFSGNVKKELGDILWFVSAFCSHYGFTLEDVAQTNLDKLESRRQRGTIQGSGNDR